MFPYLGTQKAKTHSSRDGMPLDHTTSRLGSCPAGAAYLLRIQVFGFASNVLSLGFS